MEANSSLAPWIVNNYGVVVAEEFEKRIAGRSLSPEEQINELDHVLLHREHRPIKKDRFSAIIRRRA